MKFKKNLNSGDSCANCQGYIIFEKKTGSSFCEDCGLESNSVFIKEQIENLETPYKNQPYQEVVHMKQKMRQAMAKDPLVPTDIVNQIESYLLNNPEIMGPLLFNAGYQAIKESIKSLGLNNKYCSQWVQVGLKIIEYY